MTYRTAHAAAAIAWQDDDIPPSRTEQKRNSAAAGPSEAEAMMGRLFPLGRLRPGAANSDRPDGQSKLKAGTADGPDRSYGSHCQIATYPGSEAARICRAKPVGQSRDAVSTATSTEAIPARRIWNIPDIS